MKKLFIITVGIIIACMASIILFREVERYSLQKAAVLDKCVEFFYGEVTLKIRYPSVYKKIIQSSERTLENPQPGEMLLLLTADTGENIMAIGPYPWIDEKGIAEGLRYKRMNQKIADHSAYLNESVDGFSQILLPLNDRKVTVSFDFTSQMGHNNYIIQKILQNITLQINTNPKKNSYIEDCK